MGHSSMTCDQLLHHAAEPARVDRSGIKLPGGVGAEQQANEHRCEVGVVGVATLTIGHPIEQSGELAHDLVVEVGEPPAELGPAQGGDADLGEEDAALAIGRKLDEQEVEAADERALGVEHVELGAERRSEVLDDLLDGGDQQVFLGDEVVVHEAGREIRLGGDALDRCLRDPVLQDRGSEAVDDLAAARPRETRSSHR